MGKYNTSEIKSRKLLILDPKNALAHFNRGVNFDALQKFQESEISYRQSLIYDPNYAIAYQNLTITLIKQDKYEEASETSEKAVKLDSLDNSAYNICGYINLLQGEYEKAMLEFNQAISLAPNETLNHMNKAILLYLMGNEEKMWEILELIKKRAWNNSFGEELEIYLLELERLEKQELSDENKDKQRRDCIKGIKWMIDFLQELNKPEPLAES